MGFGNSANGAMLSPQASWLEVASGAYVDLLHPDPATLTLTDVARGLARTCRYGGHVSRFCSVAEHCVLVSDLLAHLGEPPPVVRAGLFHDAPEAYLGDAVAPLKWAMRLVAGGAANAGLVDSPFDVLNDRMERAACRAFRIDPDALRAPAIQLADLWACRIEAASLTFTGGANWRWPGDLPNGGALPDGVPWAGGVGPDEAEEGWLRAALALDELEREEAA